MMIEFITIHYCIPFIGVWAFLLVVYMKDQRSKKSASVDNGSDDFDNSDDENDNTKINNIDNRNYDRIQSTMIERSESKQHVVKQEWKCACEGNGMIFLPQSLMKSFSGPGAAMRMGAGGCYHKQM
jgi:hypothetical protein